MDREPKVSRVRDDRGDVAPTVILASLTVFLVMFVIQMGLYFHARTVLNAAAQDALRAAQVQGAGPDEGRRAADEVLHGSRSLFVNPIITIGPGPTESTLSVSITADTPSLVPFWSGRVTSNASGPQERFRPENER